MEGIAVIEVGDPFDVWRYVSRAAHRLVQVLLINVECAVGGVVASAAGGNIESSDLRGTPVGGDCLGTEVELEPRAAVGHAKVVRHRLIIDCEVHGLHRGNRRQ